MRRNRHRKGGLRSKHREYRRRRSTGWVIGLYRNTRDGKIAGVCAGLARAQVYIEPITL